MKVFFLFSCICIAAVSVSGQNCDPITQDLLGNSSGLSNVGLIPSAYVTGGDSQIPPDVQILNFNVVCEQSGDRINTARGVSVLVSFDCDSDRNDLANIMCTDGVDQNTVQFQFACSSTSDGDQWTTTIAGSSNFVASSSTMATLTTPLDNTCGACIDDAQISGSDPVTHCFDCHPDCNRGQMRCFGTGPNQCCNFYQQNLCVADCGNGLVQNSEFICGCPAPNIPLNGQVTSTGIAMIGDTVTYSCDALANLNGAATRMCTVNGWDVDEPTCDIFRCPDDLTNPLGGMVAYSDVPPIVGATASYTCDPGRVLDGNEQRTCQNDGTWGGSDPLCVLSVGVTDAATTMTTTNSSPASSTLSLGGAIAISVIITALCTTFLGLTVGIAVTYLCMKHRSTKYTVNSDEQPGPVYDEIPPSSLQTETFDIGTNAAYQPTKAAVRQ